MDYEGKIYRPWMEANSPLIQTTLGCTHNKCTFCDMFREKRFRIRKIEAIFKDIDEARQIFPRVGSIFRVLFTMALARGGEFTFVLFFSSPG